MMPPPTSAAVRRPAAVAAALMLMVALQLSAAAAAAVAMSPPPGVPIGLPNCSTTCGDVTVPYPFGLGPSRCYWPGLNLTCDTSRHPPRLLIGGDGDLRVTAISLRNQTVRVMGSRAVINTTAASDSSSWNLPFGRGFTKYGYRLSYRNELVVDGCNAAATLLADNIGAAVSVAVAGCASLCTGSRDDIDDFFFGTTACTGTSGCCRAPLTTSAPNRLQAKSLLLGSRNNHSAAAAVEPFIVYVAEEGWIDHNAMMGSAGVDEAPILLAWSVTRGLPVRGGGGGGDGDGCDDDTRRRLCRSQNSRCLADLGTGFMCQCQDGYDGNPYLPGGCQDAATPASRKKPTAWPQDKAEQIREDTRVCRGPEHRALVASRPGFTKRRVKTSPSWSTY